jgi:hypothetical protein
MPLPTIVSVMVNVTMPFVTLFLHDSNDLLWALYRTLPQLFLRLLLR